MDIDAITYMMELGGRVALSLDHENEEGPAKARRVIRNRATVAGIRATARAAADGTLPRFPSITLGGGAAPTRKSKRTVTPLKEAR